MLDEESLIIKKLGDMIDKRIRDEETAFYSLPINECKLQGVYKHANAYNTTDTVTQEWMEVTAIKKKICEELEKIFERYVDRLWEEDVKELNDYKPLIFPSVPKEDRANLEQGR